MSINIHPVSVHSSQQQGFTLIEILVALVIMSIGLLGMASLQLNGMRSNQGAYLRTQASMLAYDIADRMRANSERAIAGDYDDFDTDATEVSDPGCLDGAAGCSASSVSQTDLFEWTQRVTGAAGTIALLPDAQGVITRGDENKFTVAITWNETERDKVTSRNYTFEFEL
jgi:type IV pilus assembly protein PilV